MLSGDEAKRLKDTFDRLSAKIRDSKSSSGDERAYGIAYQALVKAGLALQIKRKYRG